MKHYIRRTNGGPDEPTDGPPKMAHVPGRPHHGCYAPIVDKRAETTHWLPVHRGIPGVTDR